MSIDTKQVTGAEKLKQRIVRIRTSLSLPDLTNDIATLLLNRTRRRFDREVDPDEKPWERLQDSTLRRKKSAGAGSAKKLVRSGKLREALGRIRAGQGAVYTNTGANLRIGISDQSVTPYARVHQSGSKTVPQRRFLGIGRLDIRAVDGLLRRRAEKIERL